ncbi:MAG: tRNA lysidine(34) synthetase TilS [Paludibacteraceae bacterium]|nr:tRNA lysidine(34) synthetase TilS [Paludibacteraceae bacterium]
MLFEKTISDFIKQQHLFPSSARVLVAVSGGADSVALLYVLVALGYDCVVAHCNFHLRGEESERDELFVTELTKKLSLPYYKTDFDTTQYASTKGISIEMAARELRYEWFESLRRELLLDVVAVAHHADDVVETFFMNIVRGTGIHGLTGIKPTQGTVVRPMLGVCRDDVLTYLTENNLTHITDSSNMDEVYARNKFRHTLIPLMQELNPSLRQTIQHEIERFNEVEILYQERLEELNLLLVEKSADGFSININLLQQQKAITSILYQLLSPVGFSSQQIPIVIDLLSESSGKQIFSATHRILKNRDKLIVSPNVEREQSEFKIDLNQSFIEEPIGMIFQVLPKEDLTINKDKNHAYFDADLLQFPLTLRHWRDGDSFFPFGMNGNKKISDYFIDHKYSLLQKEQAYLLLSGDKISWIVGERTDNRFRVNTHTKRVFCVEII